MAKKEVLQIRLNSELKQAIKDLVEAQEIDSISEYIRKTVEMDMFFQFLDTTTDPDKALKLPRSVYDYVKKRFGTNFTKEMEERSRALDGENAKAVNAVIENAASALEDIASSFEKEG